MQTRNTRFRLGVLIAIMLLVAGALWWALSGPLTALGDRKIVRPNDVPACGPAWRQVASANPSKEYSELHAITAASPEDIWSVGTKGTEEYALTLTEHWDGTTWTHVQSPSVAGYSNHLHAVAALSADDVWTVGASHSGTDLWRTLTMHWDGHAWSIVPSPTVPPISNLNGLAAVTSADIWAAGEQSTGERGAGPRPLLMHWDGRAWSIVNLSLPFYSGTLSGISALSADDIWAVGSYIDSPDSASRPLVLHWDGHAWSIVEAPSTGELAAVSGSGSNNVWAVGNNHQRTLTLHWDGRSWSMMQSPNPGNRADILDGVVVSAEGDAWAVGALSDDEGDATLALRWDGHSWNHVPSPSIGPNADTLLGVTTAGNAVWAAGSYIADAVGTNLTIVQRFNDPCKGK